MIVLKKTAENQLPLQKNRDIISNKQRGVATVRLKKY
jgi:hypothetical protein